jgi:hypothetical protein
VIDTCAVCGADVAEAQPPGVGAMIFHPTCLPTCRFCGRAYAIGDAGWDFRGGVTWSDDSGYVTRLESAACASCTDEGERRDYGSGW